MQSVPETLELLALALNTSVFNSLTIKDNISMPDAYNTSLITMENYFKSITNIIQENIKHSEKYINTNKKSRSIND